MEITKEVHVSRRFFGRLYSLMVLSNTPNCLNAPWTVKTKSRSEERHYPEFSNSDNTRSTLDLRSGSSFLSTSSVSGCLSFMKFLKVGFSNSNRRQSTPYRGPVFSPKIRQAISQSDDLRPWNLRMFRLLLNRFSGMIEHLMKGKLWIMP